MPHEIHSFSLTVIISFILTLSICLSITIFRLYFLVLLFLFLLLFRRLLIENTDTLNLLNVTFFHTHYFLSDWFFWITIISIITTFCNFLNIIKLYRREQRELSLVWPCYIWPLPQEHLQPRPLPGLCLSSSFSSSFSLSHHFLQVWEMVAHSHQNY